MRFPRYTHAAIRAARLAGCLAARAGARKAEPEHLLLALLGTKGILALTLGELGIDPAEVRAEARRLVHAGRAAVRSKPRLSSRMETILLKSEEEARGLGETAIKPHHLLLALFREGGSAARLLTERGAPYSAARQTLRRILKLPGPARCPQCGYDLRATPQKCPECGYLI